MNSSIFKIALCVFSLAIVACGNKNDTVRDSARESLGGTAPAGDNSLITPAPASNTISATPGGATPGGATPGGVHHYVCPKNCAGSGGAAAGTCPVCGSEYVHNAAFHSQTATTPPSDATSQIATFPGSTGATPGTPPPTTTPEPAQNAAGVWHYTCAKGHAGGAGSAGTCATCGGPLTHNTAYHQ
jgi:hypothetical protein